MSNIKRFVYDENKPPIHYRPGTSDEAIIQTVLIERKEYLFPKFEPKLIWDVGANIGVVSVILANIYPNARILAYEPVTENFDILEMNTKHLKNVEPRLIGLGNKTETIPIYESEDPANLGGFSNHIVSNKIKHEISIVEASEPCKTFGTPDLIKIDCEGAEYDILTSIPDLQAVKWITGELHGIKEYELLGHLNKYFKLQFTRGFGDKVWHFSALSRSWQDFGRDPAT